MLYCIASTLLTVGIVSKTLAEPFRQPYQPELARMSTRHAFNLDRREVEGYSPTQQLCGVGETCAEACGKEYKQCTSDDSLTHCYNPLKRQTCCSGGTGDSCDDGYFCTADEKGATWCCPDNLSLEECAQRYDLPGPLTSQVPPMSTTTQDLSTEASHISTSEPGHTSTKSKQPESTESTTSIKIVHQGSASNFEAGQTTTMAAHTKPTTALAIDTSSPLVPTVDVATRTTLLDYTPSSTSSTPSPTTTSSISQGGGGSFGPANSLVFLLAGALAALV